MIEHFKTTQAHARSQIPKITFTDNHKKQIASIGYDSYLRLWDIETGIKFNTEVNLEQSYLTTLYSKREGNSFLIGNGDGELVLIDKNNLREQKRVKLHSDCLTDILEEQNRFITVGYDGVVNFIDKSDFRVINSITIQRPLSQIVKFKDYYYCANSKAYRFNETSQVKEIGNIKSLMTAFGKLYGVNDQNGFFCQSKKFNSYVPCEQMIALNYGVLGTSWSTITYFTSDSEQRISYKSTKIEEMVHGDSILSLIRDEHHIYGGAESGNIYSFNINVESQSFY